MSQNLVTAAVESALQIALSQKESEIEQVPRPVPTYFSTNALMTPLREGTI